MTTSFRIFPPRRRLIAILALLLLPLLAWLLWSPGADVRDGRHDLGTNGIWMEHGWLGDDAWLARNNKPVAEFRDPAQVANTAAFLKMHHFHFVFPHLCPAQPGGAIAASDAAQVERFLDGFEGMEVLPWVGGVRGDSAPIASPAWRSAFAASCAAFLRQHPRLAGVHVNIEPLPSGYADFLALLEEMKRALPPGKKLSVAAYPPPTRWQPIADVHWDEAYSRAVASRVDQAVVMMYDTGLRSTRLYRQLMQDWTVEVLAWYAPTQVLIGVPAYDDAGVGYHDPATENLENALIGMHGGLDPMPANYAGISVYSEWEMYESKWVRLNQHFLRRDGH